MALAPTIARLVADASGFVAGTDKAIAATRDWQLEMDRADIASRKMAVSAAASADRAAAAQAKLTASTEEAAVAQRELAAVQEGLATGQIGAADAAEREAVAQTQLTAANERAARASIQLERASISQAEAQMRTAAASREAAATTTAASTEAAATTTRVNSTAAGASAGAWSRYSGIAKVAVAAVGYESVKTAANFQTATNLLVTSAGEQASSLGLVRKGLIDMAGQVGTTATELARGMYMVESAGYHGADGLNVMRAAAQGAKIEGANVETVANALTTAMRDYNIPTSQATQTTDQLVAAVAHGKTRLEDMAGALAKVLPAGAAAHIGLNEVLGAMSTLTAQGTDANLAATYLRQTILQLANPSAKAKNEMTALGLSAGDVQSHLGERGLTGTFTILTDAIGKKFGPAGVAAIDSLRKAGDNSQKFQTALSNLPPPIQTAVGALADMVGGTKSMQAALELTGANLPTFKSNVAAVGDAANSTGKDVNGWGLFMKSLKGQLDTAGAASTSLGIQLGTALLPVVTDVMKVLSSTINFVERNSTAFKVLGIAVLSVAVPIYTITKAVAAYHAVMRGVEAVQLLWGGIVGVYERVATSMGFVTGAGERMIATQAEVEAEVASTAAALEGETVAADSAATSITVLTEAEARAGSVAIVTGGEINRLAASEAAAGTAAAGAATEVSALGAAETRAGAAGDVAAGGIGRAGASAAAANVRFGAVAAGALALVNNFHAAASAGGNAKKVVDGLMTVQNRSSVTDYQKRVSDLETELHKVSGVGAFFKGIIGSVGFGKSGQQMITESNKIGKALEVAKQQAANAQLATSALGAEYNLNGQQVEGLAHKYGIDLGGSVVASMGRFQQLQGNMGNTGAASTTLKGHVDALGNAVRAVPTEHHTNVSTPGAQQSTTQVQLLHRTLDGIHDITHTVTTIFKTVGSAVGDTASQLWGRLTHPFGHAAGGLVGFADGGLIRGPGTGTSDSILGLAAGGMPTAAVSNGEYVVNAAQTAKNLPLLDAINSGKGAGKGSLDAGYGKLAADTTALTTKSRDLTKRFVEQTKAVKDQNTSIDDGHTKLLALTDATTAHHTAVDALIPRVVASTGVHLTDHRTVDGLTGGYHTLTGAIQATPTAHHTNTDAPGAVNTTGQIRTLESTIRAMQPKTDRINIDTSVSGVFASLFARGGRVGYATGGQLRGPGTGTSDSIPIMASHGEFVVNAQDTARTLPLLQAINAGMFAQGGLIRKFAAGGAVAARVSDPTGTDAGRYVGGAANLINRVDAMLNPKAHSLIEHKAAAELKKKLAAMTAGVGGGVARWAPLVLAVDKMLGLSPGLLAVELSQMSTESGGNPGSINLTDSNAAAGHPSQGLMQVIPGTFAAYAGPFRGRGILDPLANIYAGLNYAKHRYGPGLSALGHGHGYAAGGYVGLSPGQIGTAKADMSALGFGSNIRAAQSRLGVSADGIVGPRTFAALQRAVSRPVPAAERAFLGMLANESKQVQFNEGWSGLLGSLPTTRNNVPVFSTWLGQMTNYEKHEAGFVAASRRNLAAHPGNRNAIALLNTAVGWDNRAKALVAQAQTMQDRARAAFAGPEATVRTAGPSSQGYSWLALHSPVAPTPTASGPSHANVTTVIKLDSKVLYAGMQTQALKNEKRNLSNGLSKTR